MIRALIGVLAFLDGDEDWNGIACPCIGLLVVFGFVYSFWRHYGSGKKTTDVTRGFEVKANTGGMPVTEKKRDSGD